MALYLLDTNHVRFLEQCQLPFMNHYLAHIPNVGTSAISVQEVFKGRLAAIAIARKPIDLINGYRYLEDSLAALAQVPLVQYDVDADREFQALRGLRLRVSSQDLRIAVIASAKNLTLVTSNTRDFAGIPGLQIADWSR
jgi:tRNA(fMet)-specific endonuclease VapC